MDVGPSISFPLLCLVCWELEHTGEMQWAIKTDGLSLNLGDTSCVTGQLASLSLSFSPVKWGCLRHLLIGLVER